MAIALIPTWALFIVPLISSIISIIWYSPQVFGAAWVKALKIKPHITNVTSTMVGAYAGELLQAYGIAFVMEQSGAFDTIAAVRVALVMCLAFIAPCLYAGVLWKNKSMQAFWIELGGTTLSLCTIAALFSLFV